MTPIFKKGDSRYLDNYRPVSTLPLFGKILEKLIYNRLYSFFTAKNTIYENQYGFRKKHLTSHAVNLSVKQIIDQIEKKRHVIGIFIDLSKAFDTISHEKLIYKMNFYGIRGVSLELINLLKVISQDEYNLRNFSQKILMKVILSMVFLKGRF